MIKRTTKIEKWASEADLCAAFIAHAERTKAWRAYPETAGWDILMVRGSDGLQIGIEAKLALNIKVLDQALDGSRWYNTDGPDLRAVLVPTYADGGLERIAGALGITVIRFTKDDPSAGRWAGSYSGASHYRPGLPGDDWQLEYDWHPWLPMKRAVVPDYVPDVRAGVAAPVALTAWKVKAIRIAVLLETRPVTRADFKALQIDPSRWVDRHTGWLKADPEGRGYIAGPGLPDFKRQHPRNYDEIKADIAKWAPSYAPPVALPLLAGGPP